MGSAAAAVVRSVRACVAHKRTQADRPHGPISERRFASWRTLRGWEHDQARRLQTWQRGVHVATLVGQQAARALRGDLPLYPYPVPELGGELRSTFARDLLGWVVFAWRLYHGASLVGSYERLAVLVGCAESTSERLIGVLVGRGLLEKTAHYVVEPDGEGRPIAWSLANSYRPGKRLRSILEESDRRRAAARRAAAVELRRSRSTGPQPRGSDGERATTARAVARTRVAGPPLVVGGACGADGVPCGDGPAPAAPQCVAPAAPAAPCPTDQPSTEGSGLGGLAPSSPRSAEKPSVGAVCAPRSVAQLVRPATRRPVGAPAYPGRTVRLRTELAAADRVVAGADTGAAWSAWDDRGSVYLALLRDIAGSDDV